MFMLGNAVLQKNMHKVSFEKWISAYNANFNRVCFNFVSIGMVSFNYNCIFPFQGTTVLYCPTQASYQIVNNCFESFLPFYANEMTTVIQWSFLSLYTITVTRFIHKMFKLYLILSIHRVNLYCYLKYSGFNQFIFFLVILKSELKTNRVLAIKLKKIQLFRVKVAW